MHMLVAEQRHGTSFSCWTRASQMCGASRWGRCYCRCAKQGSWYHESFARITHEWWTPQVIFFLNCSSRGISAHFVGVGQWSTTAWRVRFTNILWQTQHGCAPLMCATAKGQTECAKMLLDSGANKDLPSSVRGATYLLRAFSRICANIFPSFCMGIGILLYVFVLTVFDVDVFGESFIFRFVSSSYLIAS